MLSEGLAAELDVDSRSVGHPACRELVGDSDRIAARQERRRRPRVRLTVRQILRARGPRRVLAEPAPGCRPRDLRPAPTDADAARTARSRERHSGWPARCSSSRAPAPPVCAASKTSGLRVRTLEPLGAIALDSRSTMLGEAAAAAAMRAADALRFNVIPALTYLANAIRVGDRNIPYSAVTAIDLSALGWLPQSSVRLSRTKPASRTNLIPDRSS